MKVSEINALTDEALIHTRVRLDEEYALARFRLATQQLEDSSRLTKIRKDIARLETVARQRELAQGLHRNGLYSRYRATYRGEVAGKVAGAGASTNFLKGILDQAPLSEQSQLDTPSQTE